MRGWVWCAVLVSSCPIASLACGDGIVTLDDFDQSCDVDADCVAVAEVGQCCICPTRAINRDDLAEYDEVGDCPVCGNDCAFEVGARCDDGTCVAHECTPGKSFACDDGCPEGGVAICLENGSGLGPCECDD